MPNRFQETLECGHCGLEHSPLEVQTTCRTCEGPLLSLYDLAHPDLPSLTEVKARPPGQFRFHEVLPLDQADRTPTLGEGATPLVATPRLPGAVWIKDEAQNPTGSFKARGMAVAMARAVELGLTSFVVPSNGNAGGAAAAYGAIHEVDVVVFVPEATPATLIEESRAHGATVELVEGTIATAGQAATRHAEDHGSFNLATLREPYRLEGKKMMGYEILWDLGRLPDVIVYPTGGGTGLIGMVNAFDEMELLGWIGSERPRMVAVQVDVCAPIVKAFHEGANRATAWPEAGETSAFGLRVPSAVGDRLMLEGLRRTGGTAVAVNEAEMLEATDRLASLAGVWGTPEGGACLAAAERLTRTGWIQDGETTVIFNTAAATKYR